MWGFLMRLLTFPCGSFVLTRSAPLSFHQWHSTFHRADWPTVSFTLAGTMLFSCIRTLNKALFWMCTTARFFLMPSALELLTRRDFPLNIVQRPVNIIPVPTSIIHPPTNIIQHPRSAEHMPALGNLVGNYYKPGHIVFLSKLDELGYVSFYCADDLRTAQ